MPKLKNFNFDEPRAHRFLSEFAHHVGEEKFEDNGRVSHFHKRHHGMGHGYGFGFSDEPVESDLMRAARIEKEKQEKEKERKREEAIREKARHWWEKK